MIIGIEISSDFGHFSHPATIYSSLTYPVPPKTTVMGMLGAILGASDYLFFNDIGYSCVVKNLDGKRNFCFNGVKDALKELNLEKAGQGFTKGRKQFYRELLINPKYEIYIDLANIEKTVVDKLLNILQDGKSMYHLYMGVNFCLASYIFLGSFEGNVIIDESVQIDSIVPLNSDFAIEDGKNYTDVRFATTIREGRIFGGFSDYLVETSGKSILCNNIKYCDVNGKKVVLM